ncbi:MAG: enoyl-CoA hydratase/isomerase family protein [Frankiales bacterium]|nr:enoyl-CoA hydratase/isomerase family protein [Frankiales bacterium]
MTIQLERDGDVFVLNLGDDENRFNPTWVEGVQGALAEVTATEGPRALVTIGSGKFWSNGLDLDWMGANSDESPRFLAQVHALFGAFLESAVPTVAAVQGHAFAAGAMLAVAHDRVLMRADRGYWCVPEVDLGLPFTPGMNALLQARLAQPTAHEAMTTGRRYTGPEAVSAGIAATCHDLDELLEAAVTWAGTQAGKAGPTLATIKRRMYSTALHVLATEDAGVGGGT